MSLFVLLCVLTSCGTGATLRDETADGGLLTYSYQTDADVLSSPARRDAMDIAAERCPQGYRIVKEGQVAKVSPATEKNWRGQIGFDRRWGIQFQCK
ncbi:MAG: hypothetical protein U0172_02615 [Nitrospiraceae bacterium]